MKLLNHIIFEGIKCRFLRRNNIFIDIRFLFENDTFTYENTLHK